jgi:hypothetical protein
LDPACLKENGSLDLTAAEDLCISGLEDYHKPEFMHTFPYAKVENLPAF